MFVTFGLFFSVLSSFDVQVALFSVVPLVLYWYLCCVMCSPLPAFGGTKGELGEPYELGKGRKVLNSEVKTCFFTCPCLFYFSLVANCIKMWSCGPAKRGFHILFHCCVYTWIRLRLAYSHESVK